MSVSDLTKYLVTNQINKSTSLLASERVEAGLICIFIYPRSLLKGLELHLSYFKAWRHVILVIKDEF